MTTYYRLRAGRWNPAFRRDDLYPLVRRDNVPGYIFVEAGGRPRCVWEEDFEVAVPEPAGQGGPAPAPPTLEELRTQPLRRTGAELLAMLQRECFLGAFRDGVALVRDTEDSLAMVLGAGGPVHSAVVHLAVAVAKRWVLPGRRGKGFTWWPAEDLADGSRVEAVLANEFPIAIGQGATKSAALLNLELLRTVLGDREGGKA